ncbi:MAG: hypothetical protein J2P46_07390 [Zavarzinella sp.]|nr:hypothetical protein [Zavarzinella sp.]
MNQEKLREFFQRKREKSKPSSIDWAAKRDDWIAAVRRLFQTIRSNYLRSAAGEVELTEREKGVTEDFVGQYRVPELVLRVGDEEVVFSPKGVNVVGAAGRVDVFGDRGDATLVWQGGDDWSIVAARVPVLRLIPLTGESLADLLAGIMRP